MMRLGKDEICSIVSGTSAASSEKLSATGAEYDSRLIKGGELFVALKGEVEHGHKYVQTAYDRGAALFLVEDNALLKSSFGERVIVVEDSLVAFWKLAEHWRLLLKLPTIAVTGSVGKTTTKEMLASILIQLGAGNYAQKSFNNHVGVPYTLLKASAQHLWQVIEIGMNAPGEIGALSKITHPDVAVITEVAPAHIGAFKNLEGIGYEKLSITEGLKSGTPLIVNGDNEVIKKLVAEKKIDTAFQVISVGESPTNTYRLSDIQTDGVDTIKFNLATTEQTTPFQIAATLHIAGPHNARNASLAVVAAKTLMPKITAEQIVKGLDRFIAPLMRLNWKELTGDRMMLDDSYNANPASMKAMLDIASEVKKAGKKIGLILGDMLELGEFSPHYHTELGKQVSALSPEFLFLVGPASQYIKEGAGAVRTTVFKTPEEAGEAARAEGFDMIFIKASRGIGLDRAVKQFSTIKE